MAERITLAEQIAALETGLPAMERALPYLGSSPSLSSADVARVVAGATAGLATLKWLALHEAEIRADVRKEKP